MSGFSQRRVPEAPACCSRRQYCMLRAHMTLYCVPDISHILFIHSSVDGHLCYLHFWLLSIIYYERLCASLCVNMFSAVLYGHVGVGVRGHLVSLLHSARSCWAVLHRSCATLPHDVRGFSPVASWGPERPRGALTPSVSTAEHSFVLVIGAQLFKLDAWGPFSKPLTILTPSVHQ